MRQTPVKVVDAIMGSGKTTGMFKLMGDGYSKEGKKYFYVSLFNSEVGDGNTKTKGRIHEELDYMDFRMPRNVGQGKKQNIKDLMKKGHNISTTHASFRSFDKEAIDLMVEKGYTLVIDESLDCITTYEDLKVFDLNLLIGMEYISVSEDDGKLTWTGEDITEEDTKFFDVMKLCNTESLYKYGDDLIMWEYPPLLLKMLEEVYVITYLFEGSIMCSWMNKNGILYEKMSHSKLGLRPEHEIKQSIRDNLELLKSTAVQSIRQEKTSTKEHQFSSGWYKRNCITDGSKDENKQLLPATDMMIKMRKAIESTVSRTKSSNRTMFWTTFKSYKKGLSGKGYKQTPRNGLEPFLACNTKATNDYRDHTLCVYSVNVFKTPIEVSYLKSRGIEFDNDLYSLSEMIQFIFRGSIRKGEHMKLLVFSDRMENLLMEWLYD